MQGQSHTDCARPTEIEADRPNGNVTAANRFKIAKRVRRGIPQQSADEDRQRVSVNPPEEPTGKPRSHADDSRHLQAMTTISCGFKASSVRRQTPVNDKCLSLYHRLCQTSVGYGVNSGPT
jgi:hypothetical protein